MSTATPSPAALSSDPTAGAVRPTAAAPRTVGRPGAASGRDLAWERIEPFLAEHGHAVTSVEARRLGLTANDLRGLVRRRRLERVSQGAYIDHRHASTGGSVRHLAVVRAILRHRVGQVGASHTSAAVVLGLPVLRQDLGQVHVARRSGTQDGRRHDAFTLHRCPGSDAFTTVQGLDVVVPALAVIQTTLAVGVRSGIAVADAALRAHQVTHEELHDWLDRLGRTPGLGAARHVVQLASSTAESPGESLTRLVLHELGLAVIPQFRLAEEDGLVVARVDFFLPELGVVVEFDGMVKYGGAEGPEALAAEKLREDRIRALGYGVVRLTWADVFQPARVRAAVHQAARWVCTARSA